MDENEQNIENWQIKINKFFAGWWARPRGCKMLCSHVELRR